MFTTIHVTLNFPASRFEDADDSLSACADEVRADHDLPREYDLAPRWGDEQRETIEVDVPRWAQRESS